jgi:hypothetical protein
VADTTYRGYTAAIASALTTELNSLGNAANSAASAAIDNRTNLDLWHDLTLNVATQGSARSAGAAIMVFLVPALDDTTYDAVHETTAEQVATFTLDAAVTARQLTRRRVSIPPGLFKYFVRNATGQALAATTNTLKYRAYSLKTV